MDHAGNGKILEARQRFLRGKAAAACTLKKKQRYLYVLGTERGEKFLNSGSALSTVLNRNATLRKNFNAKFGDRYRTMRDYYLPRKRLEGV